MLLYRHTPVEDLSHHPTCVRAGVRLLVKREDLNHPEITGNKWWKLKHNLDAAVGLPHKTILTFGGAFSNHIYATAAGARETGLRAIGVIRGEETLPLNPTLRFATARGMKIHYVDRKLYRKKTTQEFLDDLHTQFGDFYLIPEGGSNLLAVKGCAEFAETYLSKIAFDHLFLPVGTGGTMAGIVSGLRGSRKITGVAVLKQGAFLGAEVEGMINGFCGKPFSNWSILTTYHEGGYAKVSTALATFIDKMKTGFGLALDHVYTGKLFMAVMKEIEAGAFARGSTVLVLHTGGLQGAMTRPAASTSTPP